jgi:hypothetical protein
MISKKAYQKMMEARLKDLDAKVEMLKLKADKAKIEAKIKYYDQIQEVKTKQQLVRQKFNDLKEAGDDAWEELKSGADKAWEDFKDGLDRAISRFKKRP